MSKKTHLFEVLTIIHNCMDANKSSNPIPSCHYKCHCGIILITCKPHWYGHSWSWGWRICTLHYQLVARKNQITPFPPWRGAYMYWDDPQFAISKILMTLHQTINLIKSLGKSKWELKHSFHKHFCNSCAHAYWEASWSSFSLPTCQSHSRCIGSPPHACQTKPRLY